MRWMQKFRNVRRFLLIFLLYLSGALLFTFPLIKQFGTHIPIGSESSGTVPFLNIWILKWNLLQFSDFLPDYWNAPILYPASGAFAFSEPQPLAGLLLLPLRGAGLATIYNSLFLFYLVANSFSAFLLLRYTRVPTFLSLLGGLWVQLLPFLTHERGVIQLQPVFPFVLTLLASIHLLRMPNLKRAALLALSLAATLYLSENYGLILGIAMIPFGVYALQSSWKAARLFLLAGIIAILLTLPLIVPQLNFLAEHSFARSERSIGGGSASVLDYVTPSKTILGSSFNLFESTKFGLYPGIGLLALGFIGLVRARKNENLQSFATPLTLSLLLCLLLSFGLNLKLFDWQPYALIAEKLPGFEHLRSPFRFGIWIQLSLLIFAVHFLNELRAKKYFWPLIFSVLVISIEIFPQPAKLAKIPTLPDFEGIQSPAIFLPYVQGSSASAYTQSTHYMLAAQNSDIIIVNGYSGYLTHANADLKKLLGAFPDQTSLQALDEIGVNTILVVKGWLIEEQGVELDGFLKKGCLISVGEQAGYLIYELVHSEPR